jgi:hypothetical protein
LNDEPGKVFSLFTPEEEKKWAPGWEYTLLYPQNGILEKNFMFLTTVHDHADEPKIEIVCNDAGKGKTFAHVTYTYTSLSEEGNIFLESFTEKYYTQYISQWEKAINYYLRTGKVIND